MKWALFLGLVTLAFSQEIAPEVPTPDPEVPIIRCKRLPICEPPCKLDNSGDCPECRCEQPPIEPCAIPMCAMPADGPCKYGFKNDDRGCMTCECKEVDPCLAATCPEGTECKPRMEGKEEFQCVEKLDCSMYKCMLMGCPHGRKKDEKGCHTCECADVCEAHDCGAEHLECRPKMSECEHNECPLVADCGLKTLCHRRLEEHHQMMSAQHKQDGDELEELHGPPHGMGMGMGPGGIMGHGMMGRGLRRVVRSISRMRDMPPMPMCDKDGNFLPRQCHPMRRECWCVDDRGVKIEGTLKTYTSDADMQTCVNNVTKSVHGKFQMKHDLDNVQEHLNNIKTATHEQLSQWLYIQKEYIVQVEVVPSTNEINILEVEFVMVTDATGHVDLATAMYHFHTQVQREECHMDYAGHTLTPKPESVQVQHHFEPALPKHGLVEEDGDFYEEHKTAILAALLGCAFLLLILMVLLKMVMSKKTDQFRHKRMQYKENLAFTNELYGQLGGDKPRLEFIDVEEEQREEEKREPVPDSTA